MNKNKVMDVMLSIIYVLSFLFIIFFIGDYLYNKESFKLYEDDISLIINDEYQLKLLGTVDLKDPEDFTFTSNDESILEVDENGNIKGLKKGNAIVNVTSKHGLITKQVKVNVDGNELYSISFKETQVTIEKGKSKQLSVILNDNTKLVNNIKYISTNEKVVTVDSNGKIKGISEGTAKIIATTSDEKVAISCKIIVKSSNKNPKSISVAKKEITLDIDETYKIKTTLTPSNANNKLKYTSSNKKIATVSSSGTITAVSPGTVTITVTTVNNKKATVKVKVNENITDGDFTIKSLKLEKSNVKLNEKETYKIKPVIETNNYSMVEMTWTSSNKKVASVDKEGKVTALSVGTATITLKLNDGKTANFVVEVVKPIIEIQVENIELTKKEITLKAGSTQSIEATISPSNATNKNITWTSSNSSVAIVENGKIGAVIPGTAIITATTSNNKKATCKVIVEAVAPQLTIENEFNTIVENETKKINTLVTKGTGKNPVVTYASSNTGVLKVDASGNVTAIKPGTAKITIKVVDEYNQSATSSFNVEVKKKTISVEKITLDTSKVTMYVGRTKKLTATIFPSNASNQNIKWTTTNKNIVNVDDNGNITAVSAGTAIITAASEDGNKKSTSTITVLKVTKDKTRLVLEINQKVDIDSINTKECSYEIKDTSIANIQNGYIVGLKAGTTTITNKTTKETLNLYVTEQGDKIHFLDVQDYTKTNGDCILLEKTYNGKKVYGLIDSGHSTRSYEPIIAYLNDIGATHISWMLLTHFHGDHYGGLQKIIKGGIKIDKIYLKEYKGGISAFGDNIDYDEEYIKLKREQSLKTFKTMIENLKKANTEVHYVTKNENTKITDDGFNIKLYNTDYYFEGIEDLCLTLAVTKNVACSENVNSIVAYTKINGKNVLLAADIQNLNTTIVNELDSNKYGNNIYKIYKEIKDSNNISKINIFKVAHHGIDGNNPKKALELINPDISVFSALEDSSQVKATYNRLNSINSKSYFTGDSNILVNISNKGSITVTKVQSDRNNNGCSYKNTNDCI